jgi:hypothetical protein
VLNPKLAVGDVAAADVVLDAASGSILGPAVVLRLDIRRKI